MAFLLALAAIARETGSCRLLYARINWDKLFESASPPGAPSASVAKGSYTRQALRAKHQRRMELRSGPRGFLAALAAA